MDEASDEKLALFMQRLVNERNRDRALTNGRGYALHVAGADIPNGKDAS